MIADRSDYLEAQMAERHQRRPSRQDVSTTSRAAGDEPEARRRRTAFRGKTDIYSKAVKFKESYMLLFSCAKTRLAGAVLAVGVCAFAQAPQKPAGAKKGVSSTAASQKSEPKFKAIWKPVNVKQDLELSSVHFISPEEGWVAGGSTSMAG